VGLGRQAVHQPPVRRLAGEALVENALSGAVPDGQLEPRIIGQQVVVVLVDVAEGQGVEVLAEQFDLLVSRARRVAGVGEPGGQVGGEAEAVIDLAEQEGPGVVGDSGIGLPELDGSVKRGLEEPSLAFTHEVHLPFRALRL
jgi:hypothetical protein